MYMHLRGRFHRKCSSSILVEALTQPNAPESPEIYNHHLHLPDITGTVSVTVSDRNLQGEHAPPPPPPPPLHDSGELAHVRARRGEMHLSISSR